MPFKCVNCDKVVYNKDDQDCDCGSKTKFVKCETIHYMHEEGTGAPFAKQRKTIGIPNQLSVTEKVSLNLCCSVPKLPTVPMVSVVKSIVTCKDCRDFINSLVESE